MKDVFFATVPGSEIKAAYQKICQSISIIQ